MSRPEKRKPVCEITWRTDQPIETRQQFVLAKSVLKNIDGRIARCKEGEGRRAYLERERKIITDAMDGYIALCKRAANG